MRASSVASLTLLLCILAGCTTVETRKVKISPSPIPPNTVESKLPLTAALVLDSEFKNYAIRHELIGWLFESASAQYPMGGYLCDYAKGVSQALFLEVSLCDSVEAAANKADLVLIPKAVRSSTRITAPVEVSLVLEWLAKDRAGQQTLWLRSVESSSSVTPGAFSHGKAERAAYQQVFDDLTVKTLKAFQESPEIKRLAQQSR